VDDGGPCTRARGTQPPAGSTTADDLITRSGSSRQTVRDVVRSTRPTRHPSHVLPGDVAVVMWGAAAGRQLRSLDQDRATTSPTVPTRSAAQRLATWSLLSLSRTEPNPDEPRRPWYPRGLCRTAAQRSEHVAHRGSRVKPVLAGARELARILHRIPTPANDGRSPRARSKDSARTQNQLPCTTAFAQWATARSSATMN